MIRPSIDLSGGRAVQWRQGREHVLARDDVMELFDRFSVFGEVAIVDLDAATGRGDNRELIAELLHRGPARVGGGIRDRATAEWYLRAGASKLVLGTACRESFVEDLPRDALVFAIDAKNDDWTVNGWTRETGDRVLDVIEPLAERCGEFLYTQVEREGMMRGLDRPRIEAVLDASPVPVTVAGGVTTPEDVRYLALRGAAAQIGMAVYTGQLALEDCVIACLDFEKAPLIPTVAQCAETGDVLMLAYSTEASLREAMATRRGVYFSRSRQSIWRKGETSGHRQTLEQIAVDCDGDSILFTVRQAGRACHLPRRTCFGDRRPTFDLGTLDRTLANRQREGSRQSFTAKLLASPSLRAAKLREECEELIEAEGREAVRWEAADLLYFTLTMARASNVDLRAITSELRCRHVVR